MLTLLVSRSLQIIVILEGIEKNVTVEQFHKKL